MQDDGLFRPLTKKEEQEFRDWARENFVPGDVIKSVWHPIVQEECAIMIAEKRSIDDPFSNSDNNF